jgi:alcohol dehydrogenase class IV
LPNNITAFTMPRWIEGEPGCIDRTGVWAARYGNKAFVGIGGGSVKKNGVLHRVLKSLDKAGVGCELFEGIEAEPSVDTVDRAAELARRTGCELFIALGGGSVLDVIKAVAVLEANPGKAEEYQLGNKEIIRPCKPVIGIPTTAGTGSEGTKISVLTNHRLRVKKSVYTWEMLPTVVLLDAEVTVDLPPKLTRETGLDALGQAVEGYLSTGGNPVTVAASAQAIKLIRNNLPRTMEQGDDLEARQAMLAASFLGGIAIGSGVGLGHDLAMAVGSYKGISHGLLVGVLTPYCLEANLGWADDKIAEIAFQFGCRPEGDNVTYARSGVRAFHEFNRQLGHPKSLGEIGVSIPDIPEILEAGKLSTDIRTNPRPLDDKLRAEVLEAAIGGRSF